MRELGGILAHKVVDPEEIKQDEELTLAKFSYCASSNKLSANGVE
jgi:hypothetical protein